ncbi:MAG TPA: peptide deformylase [Candidatus Saccharimonadales bacterium]|nr:peptide deformylase [Candidatus Saccharimonadales bacterium]
MKKEDIITLPNANLRQRSRRVGLITPEIKKLVENMKAATLDWEDSRKHEITVGLAAIQINQLLRIFIVRDTTNQSKATFIAFINPEITKYEGKITSEYEGCLSVQDIYGMVPRRDAIRIKAQDLDGKTFTMKVKGELARIIQHEADHTNGILFIDHIKDDPEAFYILNADGNLEKLDYDKDVKDNKVLWP